MTVDNQNTNRLADDPAMPRPGDVLGGRYRIDSVLGEGGFAAVFKATDARTGKAFAVKVLDPLMSRRDEFRQRFFLEVSNSSKLNHVNTIQVSDQGETDTGCLYLVMELLDGKSLDDLLHERGPMPAHIVHSVAIQALRSLREAHALGILHRDIKPANIMLVNHTDDVQDFFVKLLDFGIAKSMDGTEDAALTSTGQVMCSPHYVAPERIVDHETYPSSDLYSLGVSMIEMLEGTPPYEGENSIQLVMMHARMDSPLPMKESTRNSPLGAIIEKVTAKDYGDRYQTAQEMIDALRAIDFSKPHAVVPPPPAEETSGGILQYWPVALLFFIVLGVGLLLWTLLNSDETSDDARADTTDAKMVDVSAQDTESTHDIDPDDDDAVLGLVEDNLAVGDSPIYTLTSTPSGARIYIDDTYVETTPWSFEEHNLDAPPFSLKLTLDDGREVTRTIETLSELQNLSIAFSSPSSDTPARSNTAPKPPSTRAPRRPSSAAQAPADTPTPKASAPSDSASPSGTQNDVPTTSTTEPEEPAPATPRPKPTPAKPAPTKPTPAKPAPPKEEPKAPTPDPSQELLEKLRQGGSGGYGGAKPSGGYVQ